MRTFVASLKSISPYSQSKHHMTPKLSREQADDYEKRTWPEKLHINEDGNVIITPMTFKNCLSNAAQFISEQIPGKGKSTYTKLGFISLMRTSAIRSSKSGRET